MLIFLRFYDILKSDKVNTLYGRGECVESGNNMVIICNFSVCVNFCSLDNMVLASGTAYL